jgi:hypothetical protein
MTTDQPNWRAMWWRARHAKKQGKRVRLRCVDGVWKLSIDGVVV